MRCHRGSARLMGLEIRSRRVRADCRMRDVRGRRLRVEPLEERQMLSVAADPLDILRESASVEPRSPGSLTVNLRCPDYSLETSIAGYAVTASGLTASGEPGQPELPRSTISVALPPDADLATVALSATVTQETSLAGNYDLAHGPRGRRRLGERPVRLRRAHEHFGQRSRHGGLFDQRGIRPAALHAR